MKCDWCGRFYSSDALSFQDKRFCSEKCFSDWKDRTFPKETCSFCGKPLGSGRIMMEDGREVCGQACADEIMPSVQETMKERERIALERERIREETRRREEAESVEKKRRQDEEFARRHAPKTGAVSKLSIMVAEARSAPHWMGGVAKDEFGRELTAKDYCTLRIGAIENPSQSPTGTLRVSILYCPEPYQKGIPQGEVVWSEPLHNCLGPQGRFQALEFHVAIGKYKESDGDRNVVVSVEELNVDGRWHCAAAVQIPDWGRTKEERERLRVRSKERRKQRERNTKAKWGLWLAGMAGCALFWFFSILPVWAIVLIAVFWSMLLSGFFGDIL